ncbi:MAG: hypothetical protein JWP82_1508, partial [Humibacillus sp.]|nr:hypothetical protein [Humibacillus sp.]
MGRVREGEVGREVGLTIGDRPEEVDVLGDVFGDRGQTVEDEA